MNTSPKSVIEASMTGPDKAKARLLILELNHDEVANSDPLLQSGERRTLGA